MPSGHAVRAESSIFSRRLKISASRYSNISTRIKQKKKKQKQKRKKKVIGDTCAEDVTVALRQRLPQEWQERIAGLRRIVVLKDEVAHRFQPIGIPPVDVIIVHAFERRFAPILHHRHTERGERRERTAQREEREC
jgi:hypothetical protein